MTFDPLPEPGPPPSIATVSSGDGIETRASWGAGELAGGVVAVLVLFFLLGAGVVLPAQEGFGEGSAGALAFQALTIAVWDASMVFVVYRLVRGRGAGWRNLGFLPPRSGLVTRNDKPWMGMLGLIVIAYFACYAVVAAYSVVIDLAGLDDLLPDQQIPDDFYAHDWVVALLGISIVITAPFAEETFFRGFLYGGLRRRLAVPAAALISGGLFSLAHADPGLILPFSGVGVVLALTYERAGTIYAPMGVHLLFNLVSFLILVFVPDAR